MVKRAFLGLDPHTCYSSPNPSSVRLSRGGGGGGGVDNNSSLNLDGEGKLGSSSVSEEEEWNPMFPTDEFCNQIHSERIDEVDFKSLDPSLTLGYYFRTRDEFDGFCTDLKLVNQEKVARKERPLFTIDFAPPPGLPYGCDDDLDLSLNGDTNDDDDDEYVFI